MTWTNLTFSFGSLLTSAKMTQLSDNITAVANGDSGAPEIVAAGLAAAAVTQSKLKTTTGTVSTGTFTTAPGGQYGFCPEGYTDTTDNDASSNYQYHLTLGSRKGNIIGGSYTAKFGHLSDGESIGYFRQRYVQSSPPYDLGDGEIPLFMFVELDTNGEILSTYCAPEAPWHNNGPTDIKADRYSSDGRSFKRIPIGLAEELDGGDLYESKTSKVARGVFNIDGEPEEMVEVEISQKLKNRDMDVLPDPFERPENNIILIDPVSDFCCKMFDLLNQGEDLSKLIHDGYIKIDNTALTRKGPEGVMAVNGRWKNKRRK